MSNQRTHHVMTTDGVTIGAAVHGEGPPLVFLHGAVGDGDIDWNTVVERLAGRSTCHLPSYRGRGRSGDHPDLGPGRRTEDVLAYIDSIEQPVGLVGWSLGAEVALAVAAAQPDAVDAVALVEPVVPGLMDERERSALGAAVARTAELAPAGRLAAAARAFVAWPFDDEGIAAAEDAGYLEAAGRYVPNLLGVLRRLMEQETSIADDPAVLGAISAPVLVLHGSRTKPFFIAGARHVADHVLDARVHEIPGAGHASPLTHPAELAAALAGFFSRVERPDFDQAEPVTSARATRASSGRG